MAGFLVGALIGGGIGWLIGSESTIQIRKKNPGIPVLTKAQSRARVKQLKKAGCKVEVRTMRDGTQVIMIEKKSCDVPRWKL